MSGNDFSLGRNIDQDQVGRSQPAHDPCAGDSADVQQSSDNYMSLLSTNSSVNSNVKVPPGKPNASLITSDTVTMKWEHLAKFGTTGYFAIFFKEVEGDGKWRSCNLEVQTNEAIVKDLKPNTSYQFRVKIIDGDYESPYSPISEKIKTSEIESPQENPLCPGKPNVSSIKSNMVVLTWKHAKKFEPTSYYAIYCKEVEGDGKWRKCNSDFETNHADFKDLKPNTIYQFRLKVITGDEDGPYSPFSDCIKTADETIPQNTSTIPGKPCACSIKSDTVTLNWEHAKIFGQTSYYRVFYKAVEGDGRWSSCNSEFKSNETSVNDLKPTTTYQFRVKVIDGDKEGPYSAVSDPIKTLEKEIPREILMTPGVPNGSFIKADSVTMSWEDARAFHESCRYQLSYKEVNGNWTVQAEYKSNEAVVANLKPTTTYLFRVKLIDEDDEGPYSPVSKPITTLEPAASQYLQIARQIHYADMSTKYLLPLREITDARNMIHKTRKYELGSSEYGCKFKEKTILLIGATGTGKTTLVDAILNYMLGIKFNDPYRFTITYDDTLEDSTLERKVIVKTEWITCYTVHPTHTSMLEYSLTIIDTPGFGGTIQEDSSVVEQMQALFSEGSPKGVIGIDAICIVIRASDGSLTPSQNYIFDRIMSMFGKNVVPNICSFITFCDGTRPVVISAIEQSQLPFGKHFMFNNSGLSFNNVTSGNQNAVQMHFKMGFESFNLFSEHLNRCYPVSLEQTKDVLKQRRQMENTQHNLLPKLQVGLTILQNMKKIIRDYKQFETDANANKNFEYTEKRPVHCQKKASPGLNLTNCTVCNYTCHEDCSLPDDDKKAECEAMDLDGNCIECKGKCHWSVHKNTPYIFYIETKDYSEISENKKEVYDTATKQLASAKFDIEQKEKEYESQKEDVKHMLLDLKKCHDTLKKIALRPVVLSMQEYINLMIETEKNKQKMGFEDRVMELEELKKEIMIENNVNELQQEEDNFRKERLNIS